MGRIIAMQVSAIERSTLCFHARFLRVCLSRFFGCLCSFCEVLVLSVRVVAFEVKSDCRACHHREYTQDLGDDLGLVRVLDDYVSHHPAKCRDDDDEDDPSRRFENLFHFSFFRYVINCSTIPRSLPSPRR